ncbi:hypothetical protein SKAU_G00053730 [Synaphobranchus kaupii]|uniref:Uncharacterized protein n=1 Tax=Synaphobranchus kaupii TaxID=118154 RepID=A0A9Q1J9P6_SYNKA|nr:hypothetical protein SKAU_G00053730 [Synaphobranchus kaupii]
MQLNSVALLKIYMRTIMGSKNKKRVVLPSRPEPPSVEQIVEDINRAFPNDPVFSILESGIQDVNTGSSGGEVEHRYQQSRRYLELNDRLQEARGQLVRQREELRAVGDNLQRSVEEVKGRAL